MALGGRVRDGLGDDGAGLAGTGMGATIGGGVTGATGGGVGLEVGLVGREVTMLTLEDLQDFPVFAVA